MFRYGLTNKLKNSTTNIEKMTVAGASIKSGFARILQGLTGGENAAGTSSIGNGGDGELAQSTYTVPPTPTLRKSSSEDYGDNIGIERRFSHEENSDSSKDNSLQSDTSIDSEDSIISVIERIKPDSLTSPTALTSPGSLHSPKMTLGGILSHPSSPKISQVMQYPSAVTKKSLSLPASPRTVVISPSIKQTFKLPPTAYVSTSNDNGGNGYENGNGNNGSYLREIKPTDDEPVLKLTPIDQVTAAKLKSNANKEMLLLSQKLTVLRNKETEPRGDDICEGDESQKSDEHPLFVQTGEQRRKSVGDSAQTILFAGKNTNNE